MSSLQWVYDKYIKPLEERDDLTFDLLHQCMFKAKWDYFDTLSKNEAVKYISNDSKATEEFYRELLRMNDNILASCDLMFEQFYAKVKSKLITRPAGGGILLDPTCTKVLLVKCARSGIYDFPKGRADPGEDIRDTARRHIANRIGYSAILDETNPITCQKEHSLTFYYVWDVPVDVKFSPRYANAVSDAAFFDLDKIQGNGRYDGTRRVTFNVTTNLRAIKIHCQNVKARNGGTL